MIFTRGADNFCCRNDLFVRLQCIVSRKRHLVREWNYDRD